MTDFEVYDKKDPNFINDLRESRTAVSIAAEWLNRKGYPVVIKPTFERPKSSDMAEFADDGDLEIMQRIEVKRRKSLTFSSKEDFPYDSLIVDVCHSYDKAKIKPYAYIILNEKMDCAFIAYSKHQKHWKKTVKADRFKGRDREFYECPMEYIKFVKIKE
jgi:hypothetical protein